VRGEGLVGTFAVVPGPVTGARPAISLAASLDQAVAGADAVLVATPASAHATYAGVLAGSLEDGQLVVLVPGRFLGSLAVRRELTAFRCTADVTVAELSAAPYVASRDGARVTQHGTARSVQVACLPVARSGEVAARLEPLLPMLQPADSPLDTAFAGVTGVVTVAPLLTNTAAVEGKGADSLLLKDLVPAGLSRTLLSRLDQERLDVAFHYGVRDLPSAATWLREAYGDDTRDGQSAGTDNDLGTALADLEVFDNVTVGGRGGPHVTDDVPHTLVPLAYAGRAAGVPTPATDTVIALASILVGTDLMATGRSLEGLGIGGVRPTDLRRTLSSAADERPQATTWWTV
jgi:opine dehydrogenase